MANVSYDTLTIQINADSKQANSSINALSKNLLKLENVAKNLDFKSIHKVQKLLQDIANIDFSNVSAGLQSVVSAFKSLETSSRKTRNNIDGIDAEKIDLMASVFESKEPKWNNLPKFQIPQTNAPKLSSGLLERYADLKTVPTLSLDQTQKAWFDSLPAYKQDLVALKELFTSISATMKKVGNGVKAVLHPIKTLKKHLGITGDEAKKSATKFGKLVSAFKRIAFYRIVRRIIQQIGHSLSEALQEMAKFDDEFNQSISEIKSAFSYLGRSIMSMIAPIIKLLAPIISAITNQVGQLANQIGQAFSGKTFIKAEQSAEDYAESLKKVKNATLGIDELNVISQDEDKQLFSEQDGGQATFLSETFSDIMEFVGVINESLSDFMTNVLPAIKKILSPIMTIIGYIVDLVRVLVEDTNESVNQSLVDFAEMIGSIFGFVAEIVKVLMPLLLPIIKVVGNVINIINTVLSAIFNAVGGVFDILKEISPLLYLISVPLGFILQIVNTIFIVLEAVIKTIKDLITLNWGNIANDWAGVGDKIANSWSEWGQSIVSGNIGSSYTTPSSSGENANSLNQIANNSSQSSGSTEVNVYMDGEQIANRVNERNNNRGTNTLRRGTLKYVG